MKRYKILIEYDGSPFIGWQRQDVEPSVQGTIERALEKMSGSDITLHGAGRTDAGVHATGQVAHFDIRDDFPADEIMGAINHYVKPLPISVLTVEQVDDDFHSRFSAKGREYVYKIINRKAPLALDEGRAWQVKDPLDVKAMQEGARHLIGKHDFSSFRSAHCQAQSAIKTVDSIIFTRQDEKIEMKIAAPSFLHNQVRIIIGNLRKVGNGAFKPQQIKEILEAKDRTKAAETAPPDGLYLVEVIY